MIKIYAVKMTNALVTESTPAMLCSKFLMRVCPSDSDTAPAKESATYHNSSCMTAGSVVHTMTSIPKTPTVLLMSAALARTEVTPSLKAPPTIGTAEPTSIFTPFTVTESPPVAKAPFTVINPENNVAASPNTV